MYSASKLPSITHSNTLIYILGIKYVIIKNIVHVNVVHVIVEFRWNVSPRKVLTKKNPIKKNDNLQMHYWNMLL